jgi:hypothetical protein
MTPVVALPIKLPDLISQIAANVCSALIVSFTALLYLAMTLTFFLPESDRKPLKPKSPHHTFDQGEEK